MKYEKPSMELKWLESREVFMALSDEKGEGPDLVTDKNTEDGF